MDIGSIMQGAVIGFREGLEAFLIIIIMLEYLNKTNRQDLKRNVKQGLGLGILISLVFGLGMLGLSAFIGRSTGEMAKAWESSVSLIAVVLITTFIIWMIKHGRDMVGEIEGSVKTNLSKRGLLTIAAVMVAREGAEIVLFMAASRDKSLYVAGIAAGLLVAVVLSWLIYKSLVKVNLKTIFNITLAYLILQAGFLLGYAIHEGLSYFKSVGVLAGDNMIFEKVYNFADTVLDHKTGAVGIPLYVTIGWYSRPEWVQFMAQYLYTIGLFLYWRIISKKKIKNT